jgi:hypothetical protein
VDVAHRNMRCAMPIQAAEKLEEACIAVEERPFRVCVATALSPLRGLLMSHFAPQGLRPGLRSYAASRLFLDAASHFPSHLPVAAQTLQGRVSHS